MNQNKSNPSSSTKVNLWVDIILFSAILFALSPSFTGLLIHEWLGMALGGGVIVHLLLHWQWVTATISRFFSRMAGQSRFFLLLNLLLFIDFTIVVFTGVMISQEALPSVGLQIVNSPAFRGLHTSSANILLPISALHIAVHWKWIVNALRRYIITPIGSWKSATATAVVSTTAVRPAPQKVNS